MKTKRTTRICLILAGVATAASMLSGCGSGRRKDGKIEVEVVQYKQEAVAVFEALEEKFNATHDKIHLTIDSPNDAMTILKTRFIRDDAPDIIGIGGDINYSNFLDSDMLMEISDYPGLADINEAYLKIDKELEFVPVEGTYALPYAANAAGILYNKDMFEEHGWQIQGLGMHFRLSVKRYPRPASSPCTSDLKMCGPVWRRGTPSVWIWRRRMSARR